MTSKLFCTHTNLLVMDGIEIKRRVGERDISSILRLAKEIESTDLHKALEDHTWLDLVQGGRKGVLGLTAHIHGMSRLVGYLQISKGAQSWALELLIHPQFRNDKSDVGQRLLTAGIGEISKQGGGHLHLWIAKPTAYFDSLAESAGLTRGRDLLQMRLPLPTQFKPDASFSTRSFIVGKDEDEWLAVNNRAFAWHPEQGDWHLDTIVEREAETWFDPSGFYLHHIDGKLAAFCWTKIHSDHEPPLGEIYVIATDPAFAGRGIGRQMCIYALCQLSKAGLTQAMLYVDSGNLPALKLYEELGFKIDHLDRAYTADVPSSEHSCNA